MKLKKSILLLVGIAFLLIVSACGNTTEPAIKEKQQTKEEKSSVEEKVFKMYTNVPDQHLWSQTAEKFKEELEQRTDGQMTVEIFPNAQLGEVDEAIQMMETGSIDFAFIPTAFLTNDFGELNAWFMPFLFEGLEEAIKMGDSESAKKFLEVFDRKGLIGLDWLFTGNHNVLMKDTVLDTPEAFNGKKIRYVGEEPIKDLYNAFGASAVLTPLSEVYTSLQTGVIDGTVGSSNSIEPAKFYEVANEYTLLNQTAFNAAVLAGKNSFNSLSEESQSIVIEAMRAAVEWGNQASIEDTDEKQKKLEEIGLNIHEVTNFEPFYEERDKIYQKYIEKHEIIEEFINEAQGK